MLMFGLFFILERISKNPLVEESITLNRVNPDWDCFPTPLSAIRLFRFQITMTYRGGFSKHPIATETEGSVYAWTLLTQSLDLE